MATYFILEKVTREGMMSVKEAPGRSQGVLTVARKYGVEVLDWYYTLGNADFLMKVDAPDDDALAVFTMALRRSGNVTVEVLKCMEPAHWADLVERI